MQKKSTRKAKKSLISVVDAVPETVPEPEKFKDYHIEIAFNNKVTKFDTDDIYQSLLKLPVPEFIKTKTVIRYSKGTKQGRVRILNTPQAKRLYINKLTKLLLSRAIVRELNG